MLQQLRKSTSDGVIQAAQKNQLLCGRVIHRGGASFKLALQIADKMRFTSTMAAANNDHTVFIVGVINQLLKNLILTHQLGRSRHFTLFVITATEELKRRKRHVGRHEIGILGCHIVSLNRIALHYRTILFPLHELIASFTEICVKLLMGSPST